MEQLRIGDLARATLTKVETIRWYERQGLLAPRTRTAGGYRVYDAAALARLGFIRRARGLGFPLARIRALLTLADAREADCAQVDGLAGEHLAAVDRKLAELLRLRDELHALLASCRGGRVAQCRVIEALAEVRRSPSAGA